MENKWCKQLMKCAEGLYVVEEETFSIVWASDYMVKNIDTPYIGKPCWKVFFDRAERCPFCPNLSECDGVYSWDNFDFHKNRWMNIKNLIFKEGGVVYRAGNVNIIQDMMQLNYETVQEIVELQSRLQKNEGEKLILQQDAISDSTTMLFNRNGYNLDLQSDYSQMAGLGILYMDLNNLKQVNDNYGHDEGDHLIFTVAEGIRESTKDLTNAKCYRMGGDEFAIILSGCEKSDLIRCEERLAIYLNEYNRKNTIKCSIAVGNAFSKSSCNLEMLLSIADHNMYQKKKRMKT